VGVVGNGFEAEALGPGTIVGSAAFNLLGISAVCIAGIPSGETRRYLVFNIYKDVSESELLFSLADLSIHLTFKQGRVKKFHEKSAARLY
jgi:hypothetical protein